MKEYKTDSDLRYEERLSKYTSFITKEDIENDKDFSKVDDKGYMKGSVAYKFDNYWWIFTFKKNAPAFLKVVTIDPVLEWNANHIPPFTGLIYTYNDLVKLCQILQLKK